MTPRTTFAAALIALALAPYAAPVVAQPAAAQALQSAGGLDTTGLAKATDLAAASTADRQYADGLVTAAEQDDLIALKQVVLSLPRAELDAIFEGMNK